MNEDTRRFLELLNKQNAAIAAREEEQRSKSQAGGGEDPVRLQRDQERREKWGTLRAREKPGNRPHKVRRVFPYSDPS